jgi:hypothetical protein
MRSRQARIARGGSFEDANRGITQKLYVLLEVDRRTADDIASGTSPKRCSFGKQIRIGATYFQDTQQSQLVN